jgi:hypothetical protein
LLLEVRLVRRSSLRIKHASLLLLYRFEEIHKGFVALARWFCRCRCGRRRLAAACAVCGWCRG